MVGEARKREAGFALLSNHLTRVSFALSGYLMHEFHKFWIEEDPLDIMEFNRVREKFHKRILKQLQNPNMALCPHFAASESLINL